MVKKNAFWHRENPNNRPKFVYCFMQGTEKSAITLEERREYTDELEDEITELKAKIKELEEQIENMYTHEQVQYAINCAAEDGARGYYGYNDNIVSDYI